MSQFFVFRRLRAALCWFLVLGALLGSAQSAFAARQSVILVLEGASPQLLELGRDYLRVAEADPKLETAFDALAATGKSGAAPASGAALRDFLENAANNGFQTGLVTTGEVAVVAPQFYALGADAVADLTAKTARYDFLAGGGRASFGANIGARMRENGGTYLQNAAALDDEITGRVLALQAVSDLDFALDRNPTTQAGFAELTSLALDTLGQNEAPFVLIIQDTLLQKAAQTRDTPALLEQFRELNALLALVVARRETQPDLGVAVWLTGAPNTPRFTTPDSIARKNALLALSDLPLSFAGAGRALQGADEDAIAAFTDAQTGQYKGLILSPATREAIIAGTIDPETAIRALVEPILPLDFAGPAAAPRAITLGIGATGDLVADLEARIRPGGG